MGMREVESAILVELKVVSGNYKLRLKDIMEWSTGEIKQQEGETLYHLPNMGVNVAVKLPEKKSRAKADK